MAYRSLKIDTLAIMQPKGKHPLQRIPTWVALSVGIMIGLFVSKMFSSVSAYSSTTSVTLPPSLRCYEDVVGDEVRMWGVCSPQS